MILTIILGLYIAIYIYVRGKFKAVEDELSHPSVWRAVVTGEKEIDDRGEVVDKKHSPGRIKRRGPPKLHRHGLITTRSDSSSSSVNWTPQKITFDSTMPASTVLSLEVERHDQASHLQLPSRGDLVGLESPSQEETPAVPGSIAMVDVLNESRLSEREMAESRRMSKGDLEGGRKKIPHTDQLRIAHRNIRRQLRLLFVYPLVYFLMWMIPFANHCLQYGDNYSQHPSFILNCFVIIVLSLQCAVNCVLFSTREKVNHSISSQS